MARRRATYVALAIGTIAIGLLVHLQGMMLHARVRDALGDALWAAMIVWWISALAPAARGSVRYGVAYAICVVVEISQAYHSPLLDAARSNSLGRLVLGSGFDAWDLLAYAAGVVVAALIDPLGRRQSS